MKLDQLYFSFCRHFQPDFPDPHCKPLLSLLTIGIKTQTLLEFSLQCFDILHCSLPQYSGVCDPSFLGLTHLVVHHLELDLVLQ